MIQVLYRGTIFFMAGKFVRENKKGGMNKLPVTLILFFHWPTLGTDPDQDPQHWIAERILHFSSLAFTTKIVPEETRRIRIRANNSGSGRPNKYESLDPVQCLSWIKTVESVMPYKNLHAFFGSWYRAKQRETYLGRLQPVIWFVFEKSKKKTARNVKGNKKSWLNGDS
jgi:hypothetical protein